jgi:PilZ domain
VDARTINPQNRRRYERATGPFDGRLDDAVLVYDLNVGGCFINSPAEPADGSRLILQIDLGDEGWITVSAESLYRHQFGFAVRFVDLGADAAGRVARTVEAFKTRRAGRW